MNNNLNHRGNEAVRLQFSSQSQAKKWRSFSREIKDFLVDLWLSPEIAQLAAKGVPVSMTLQVLVSPSLLSEKLSVHDRRHVECLSNWLKEKGVHYQLGSAGSASSQPNLCAGAAHEIFAQLKPLIA